MIFAPDPLLIPAHLIDFLAEARIKTWKVLPKSDDGITLVLYCPDRGDYGSKFAKLFGRELNRTVEFIPIDFDRLIQAIDTQNYPTLIDCDSEFKFQCPRTWQSFELTNKSNVMKAIVIVRSNCGSYSPAWLLPRSLFKSYKNDYHTASSA